MTSSLDMIRGRQVVQMLTNQSGGSVIAGDVVIVSAANDESFTTTTSAAYNSTRVGVAQESIAAAATGRILLEGYAPLVNVSASATRGHYLLTHTVAKQATSQASYVAGAFGQILKAGTTPSAVIFPVAQVGSSGAPTTTPYVTTAADGGLSAEVVIPGLAGSADIAGAGGGGIAEEYDTVTTGLTWSAAVAVENSNTTIKSHLYVSIADSGTEHLGTRAWAPAGAFDARAHITLGTDVSSSGNDFRLIIANSDNSLRVMCGPIFNGTDGRYLVQAYTYATGSNTKRGSDNYIAGNDCYIRITRDGSNNISFYFSSDGKLWQHIATQAHTLTVAKIGYRMYNGTTTPAYGASDWLRTNV